MRGFSTFMRYCKKCDTIFRTTSKRAAVCDDCKHLNIIKRRERYLNKSMKNKTYKCFLSKDNKIKCVEINNEVEKIMCS